MAEPKYVIKKENSEGSVVSYQPKAIDLEMQEAAKTYLHHQAEKKTDFRLSELIAKQTGVADLESEVYRSRIESEVLLKLKEIQENAYKEAFELGKEEGAKRAFDSKKDELDNLAQEFSAAIEQIRTLRTEILKTREAELVEMIFLIGKKIALKEISTDPEIVKKLMIELLEEAEKDEEIKVHLSESDFAFIQERISSGQLTLKDPDKVKLTLDESIQNGGCLVETRVGSIDSTVDVRVDQAWEALAARIPKPGIPQ